MLQQITPNQYAKLIKKDVSNAQKRISKAYSKGELLPGIVKIEKFSRFYLLTATVDKDGNLI